MTSRTVVNVSTGVAEVIPYTPEEEIAHAVAVAADAAETSRQNEQKLSRSNKVARKKIDIAHLQTKLDEQIEKEQFGEALRTQAQIFKLMNEGA